MSTGPTTLAEKLWDSHVVHRAEDEPDLLYIDLHLTHEATSPQAFDGLRLAGAHRTAPGADRRAGGPQRPHGLDGDRGPGQPRPDRHAAAQLRRPTASSCTSSATGGRASCTWSARSWGSYTRAWRSSAATATPPPTAPSGRSPSASAPAMSSTCWPPRPVAIGRPRTMAVEFTGELPAGVGPKDLILALIAQIGANGAQGHVIEYRGAAVRALSMEGRMTLCNMSIEAGARAGLVAPDETTFAYLQGPPARAARRATGTTAVAHWRTLRTDDGAAFDRTVDTRRVGPDAARDLGHQPQPDGAAERAGAGPRDLHRPGGAGGGRAGPGVHGPHARHPDCARSPSTWSSSARAPTAASRTCAPAADVLRGRKVADATRLLVVPGSMQVREQAEEEGLHEVFVDAGAEWRLSGCSMCLGMNTDRLTGAAALRRPPPTATTKAVRAPPPAPTWCRRWSPRQPRWPAGWRPPPTWDARGPCNP